MEPWTLTSSRSATGLREGPVRAVKDLISEILSEQPFLKRALQPLLLSDQAKYLRAQLTIRFCEGTHLTEADRFALGVAAELIHAASLIHDDIVDEAAERRGVPSLHLTLSPAWAVLAGDFLLARGLRLIEPFGEQLLREATRVIEGLSLSAVEELELRRSQQAQNAKLSELKKIATGKTGLLFGFCFEAGALATGDLRRAEELRGAGLQLGVAFQLQDDLLDLLGAPGKPRAADLREGNPNALVALAIEHQVLPREFALTLERGAYLDAAEALLQTPAPDLLREEVAHALQSAFELMGDFEGHSRIRSMIHAYFAPSLHFTRTERPKP